MSQINENDLTAILSENYSLRKVEQDIYSVFPNNEYGNEYDTQFGFFYDLVACNPIYNRLVWGYSVKIFSQIASEALRSSQVGYALDIGCGSLAFTSRIYSQYTERPVVLVDQSIKMLRMTKSRLIKRNGKVPNNLIFLHANALQLPFQNNVFSTILSENLLHCLSDTSPLLNQIKSIISEKGRMYFTTLVKADRYSDKYLKALADKGMMVSRNIDDHKKVFERIGLSAKYETTGSVLIIKVDE